MGLPHKRQTREQLRPFALGVTPLLTQVFLLTQDIVRDFDALESVQREAARQAASHCSERGRLLTKVSQSQGDGLGTITQGEHESCLYHPSSDRLLLATAS